MPPARPLIGARMVAYCKLRRARSTAALSACTVAISPSAVATAASSCWAVTNCFAASSRNRSASRMALAAIAGSRASAASACRSAAWKSCGSIRKRTWPARTSSPSRNLTRVDDPVHLGADGRGLDRLDRAGGVDDAGHVAPNRLGNGHRHFRGRRRGAAAAGGEQEEKERGMGRPAGSRHRGNPNGGYPCTTNEPGGTLRSYLGEARPANRAGQHEHGADGAEERAPGRGEGDRAEETVGIGPDGQGEGGSPPS